MANESRMALKTGVSNGSEPESVWALTEYVRQHGDGNVLNLDGTRTNRVVLKQATAEARHALEEAVIAAAVAAQRATIYAELLDEALEQLEQAEGDATFAMQPRPEAGMPAEALSPREREVLALVAEGRSNKAIAAELFVSPNTVKTHVASLFVKLRADTRTQLAAIAARGALRSS